MLYLNTLNLSLASINKAEREAAHNLVEQIIKDYHNLDIEALFQDSYRKQLFDSYMEHNEAVFRSSSKALVYDYRNYLEKEYGEFLNTTDGEQYLSLLQAVEIIWQEVQAPVSELVAAGKSQLIKHNGGATYHNFSMNAENMPDLFGPTKKLVDHYLNTELMNVLIEYHLRGELNLSACNLCLEKLKIELQEFAVMARQLGFWVPPKESDNIVIRNIKMLEVLACC